MSLPEEDFQTADEGEDDDIGEKLLPAVVKDKPEFSDKLSIRGKKVAGYANFKPAPKKKSCTKSNPSIKKAEKEFFVGRRHMIRMDGFKRFGPPDQLMLNAVKAYNEFTQKGILGPPPPLLAKLSRDAPF